MSNNLKERLENDINELIHNKRVINHKVAVAEIKWCESDGTRVPACDVLIEWIPPLKREFFDALKTLINTDPYEIVGNDGNPKPHSFIWTVIERDGPC